MRNPRIKCPGTVINWADDFSSSLNTSFGEFCQKVWFELMIKFFSVAEGENLGTGHHFQSREPLNKTKGPVLYTEHHSRPGGQTHPVLADLDVRMGFSF